MSNERIVVVGLGYVGLPLAVALARKFEVIGLDLEMVGVSIFLSLVAGLLAGIYPSWRVCSTSARRSAITGCAS